MKRSGWVLAAAGLALLLAPLCAFAANQTRYVNLVTGNNTTAGGQGTTAGAPWQTLAYAMDNLPQPTSDTANTILRIFGAEFGTEYACTTGSLNPRLAPTGGGRYFIYGDLDNIGRVKIKRASTINTVLCSTYTTWAGMTFVNGIEFSNNPKHPQNGTYYSGLEGDTATLLTRSHTRRRLRDTLRNCVVEGDLSIQASEVTVANVTVKTYAPGLVGTDFEDTDGGYIDIGNDNSWNSDRKRTVNVHLYNVDATDMTKNPWTFFFTAGKVHSSKNPNLEFPVDSLRIWFSSFKANLATMVPYGSSNNGNKGAVFYHCQNADLRGNEWVFHNMNSNENIGFVFRDSSDNITMNCDTVIVTGPGGEQEQRIEWFENHYRSGGGSTRPTIDSCYFSSPQMRLATSSTLGGTWTYNTFISKDQLYMSPAEHIDSLQVVTFNHNNFISTQTKDVEVVAFGRIGQGRNPYGWPQRGDSGNVVVFKNNIIARCDSQATYTTGSSPLVYWGWMGDLTSASQDPNNTRTVTKKINPNWNLYLSGGKYQQYGDRSIGWQGKGSYFGDYVRAASKPGASSTWKTFADSSAKLPNMTVAAKVASFDSLSLSGFVHEARWHQWEADSLADPVNKAGADRWKYLFTKMGARLDLRIGSNSLAYGAAEGGNDIGAVQSVPSSKAVCASTDTCNSLVVSDYDNTDTTLYVRIVNNGTTALTLGSPISYAPQGSYTASGQEYSVASGGGSLLYPLTITDPTFDIPTGTYYITVRIPITDAGQSYLTLNVTINKASVVE